MKYKIITAVYLIFVIIMSFAFHNDKYVRDVFAQDLSDITNINVKRDETRIINETNEVDDFVNEIVANDKEANLTVNKSVNRAKAIIGDVLEYTIIVVNTGEAILNEIKIIDKLKSGPITLISNGPLNNLKPQESVIFLGSYVVKQIDVLDNKIANIAEVSAVSDTGEKITVLSNETVTSIINSSLNLKTIVDNETPLPGEIAIFKYVVTNIGINPIKNIKIKDENFPKNAFNPKSIDVLAPGETAIFTLNHMIPLNLAPGSIVQSNATCIGKDINNYIVESDLSSAVCIVAEIKDDDTLVSISKNPDDEPNNAYEFENTTNDVPTNPIEILPSTGEKIVSFVMSLFDKLINLFK